MVLDHFLIFCDLCDKLVYNLFLILMLLLIRIFTNFLILLQLLLFYLITFLHWRPMLYHHILITMRLLQYLSRLSGTNIRMACGYMHISFFMIVHHKRGFALIIRI